MHKQSFIKENCYQDDWRNVRNAVSHPQAGNCSGSLISNPSLDDTQFHSPPTMSQNGISSSATIRQPSWYNSSQPQYLAGDGGACEFLSQGITVRKGQELYMAPNGHIPQHQQVPVSLQVSSAFECHLALQNGHLSSAPQIKVEEDVDEHQILHWLSSEISGLIESNPDKFSGPNQGHASASVQRAQISSTPEHPPRIGSALSLPPPQTFGQDCHGWSAGAVEHWDKSGSPLTADNRSAVRVGMDCSPGMGPFQTPIRAPQVRRALM